MPQVAVAAAPTTAAYAAVSDLKKASSTATAVAKSVEPILTPDPRRVVLFPIKYPSKEQASSVKASEDTVSHISKVQLDNHEDLAVTPIEEAVRLARNLLLARIMGKAPSNRIDVTPNSDIRDAERTLFDLLNKTVAFGEGNSLMVVGARGVGKTRILRSAIEKLSSQFDGAAGKPFYEIYLNGLVHTDDRLALRSIVKQLNAEVQTTNHVSASFADTLAHVLETLKSGSSDSIPVIFVLDEMDLFALHAKQTLLYNLFDVAQKRQAPIAVIGLTTRLASHTLSVYLSYRDIVEMLEKRVKSRFSHRMIHLYPPPSFEAALKCIKQDLIIPSDHKSSGIYNPAFVQSFNQSIENLFVDVSMIEYWRRLYDQENTVWALHRHSIQPLTQLCPATPTLQPQHFIPTPESSTHPLLLDRRIESVVGLATLELCLLIAVKSVMDTSSNSCHTEFNFEMVYEAYREFAKR
eukprot:jgi/Hompol1/562/HPOL_003763-RA